MGYAAWLALIAPQSIFAYDPRGVRLLLYAPTTPLSQRERASQQPSNPSGVERAGISQSLAEHLTSIGIDAREHLIRPASAPGGSSSSSGSVLVCTTQQHLVCIVRLLQAGAGLTQHQMYMLSMVIQTCLAKPRLAEVSLHGSRGFPVTPLMQRCSQA